jgi:hypothetical protein
VGVTPTRFFDGFMPRDRISDGRNRTFPPGVPQNYTVRDMFKRAKLIYAIMEVDGKKIKVYPEHVEAAGRNWFFITGYEEVESDG